MEKLTDLLRHRVRTTPDDTAYRYRRQDRWTSLTWAEADERVNRIAAALIARGLRKGDVAAIFGRTCLEWALCDLAVLRAGGVSVGIYPTLTGDQAAYILRDASIRWLFLEGPDPWEKLRPHLGDLPGLETPFSWAPVPDVDAITDLARLEEQGRRARLEDPDSTHRSEAEIQPEDVAILVYTSGTTGPPKGAVLTHRNVVAQLEMIRSMGEMSGRDVMLFFLPLAHVGERIPGHYNRIYRGVQAAFVDDITHVLEDIQDIRPTVFGSVPRIFEKAHAKILDQAQRASAPARILFHWAMEVGREASRRERGGERIAPFLRFKRAIADRLVFRRIRSVFGGRVRYFVSSAAPISLEIIEFFHAAGLLILEGYGQTEVSCFCTLNLFHDYRLGSVGKALPGVELRVSEEGEILVKGPTVFQGYRNQPELTAETLDPDGWLHTGDLGRLDPDGFLWITGRQKEIIITAGGKNVTPSNIENMLKDHPLIDQAMVHGDRRKYLTGLLALDPENVKAWATENGYGGIPDDALLRLPALRQEIERIVEEVNGRLARFETIKRFAILPEPLQVEKGEMTPTMKVRRQVVEQRFKKLLDSLYAPDPFPNE